MTSAADRCRHSGRATPVLQPVFYGERENPPAGEDDGIEVADSGAGTSGRRATLSRRLVDELAMQRRDVLALHVASDPGLALDLAVFTLADADSHDWQARAATTLRGGVSNGPIIGFEPADAAATAALADLRSGLDETWRAGADQCERFDRFRALGDDGREHTALRSRAALKHALPDQLLHPLFDRWQGCGEAKAQRRPVQVNLRESRFTLRQMAHG